MILIVFLMFFFSGNADHRELHVLTHSFPTRRSSDLEGLSHATVAFDPEGVATHLDACSGGTGEALAGTGENQGPLVAKKRMDFRGRHCRGLHADKGSEEHTSELQSLMRISYAVFCLKKKIYHLDCQTNS